MLPSWKILSLKPNSWSSLTVYIAISYFSIQAMFKLILSYANDPQGLMRR